jgi:magnesium transporter
MEVQTDKILIEQYLTNHPEDAVQIIEKFETEETAQLLEALSEFHAAQVISQLDSATSVGFLQKIGNEKAAEIIEHLPLNSISQLMRRLPKVRQQEIITSLSREIASALKKTLSYPEKSVGALMNPFVFFLNEDFTIAQAIRRLKKTSDRITPYIYVVSNDHKLVGVLSVSELLRQESERILASIMKKDVISLIADLHYKTIINHAAWRDFHILPVIDATRVFLGILHLRDISQHDQSQMKKRSSQNLMAASGALGELYRLGIASLVQGASGFYRESDKDLTS